MSFRNKNILITGISGFVGSRLAKHLLNEGAKVFGLVRRRADGTTPQNIKYLGIENELVLLEGDMRDISSVASALDLSKPDIVFHLAAQSFIPRSCARTFTTPPGDSFPLIFINCML
jgi:GDPmannose 4,6-dehydratase